MYEVYRVDRQDFLALGFQENYSRSPPSNNVASVNGHKKIDRGVLKKRDCSPVAETKNEGSRY